MLARIRALPALVLSLSCSLLSGAQGPSSSSLAPSPLVARAAALPHIDINDNRRPAGKLEHGVLTVRLDARMGVWYPEGEEGLGLPVAAFAEEGGVLQNPGPLVRVPAGTEVRITVRNSLYKPLTLFGLAERRGIAGDSAVIAPGAERELCFTPTVAGTYYDAARTGRTPIVARGQEDSQLHGAIIVDPPGASVLPDERVFLIAWWFLLDSTSSNGLGRASMVINGRSWPHTERLDVAQGDSLRWRWINLTAIEHPLHLHGFHFRVDAVGDGATHTSYPPDQRRLAVTERVGPGATASLAWSPDRSGNWIFHCHVVAHMSHHVALGTERGVPARVRDTHAMGHDAEQGAEQGAEHGESHATRQGAAHGAGHEMAGLVLGIRVAPRGAARTPPPAPRTMRLVVRSRGNVYGNMPGYAYSSGESATPTDTGALQLPGPTLVLERGVPVAINVVNRSHEAAAVHWHGIELESFPDGVPGWSGSGHELLPAIAPGDSLTVRFTPPRAGTFMYHSHFNELQQIASGLYGAIVVVDRGTRRDPETDQLLLFSDHGPTANVVRGPFAPPLLNGRERPDPIRMRAAVPHRLRLINIRTDMNIAVELREGEAPLTWRVVAKDGAELPPSQVVTRPATLTFAPGEIYDVEFTPRTPGELTFRFTEPQLPPAVRRTTNVAVHVR